MNKLYIDNYIIDTPLADIVYDIKDLLSNHKLKDIIVKDDEIQLTCPNDAHDSGAEKNPDFHISLKDELYGVCNCFSCGTSGNFVHFVSLCFSCTYEIAKHWLIKSYGVKSFEKVDLDDFIQIKKPTIQKKYLDKSILDNYQDWCPYLAQRKLSRDICNKFHVKYDPKYRQVLFPVFDEKDNLLMVPRRSIDTKMFYMDEGQAKPVYGLNIVKKNNVKSCWLVEGPIDLLTCYTHGIVAIAILGTPAAEQIEAINKAGLISIYIATDNDSAGNKFAYTLNKDLSNTIIKTRVKLPNGRKDVNDLTDSEWDELIKRYS